VSVSLPPPYPADTRAKGWRFELDMERARQSDTWAIASPEVRPWLLMLWATAWEQTPCGSLPNDDELIAARIGMPIKLFAKHRAVLMRKWWPADDGRLYHAVLVQRVIEMMKTRRSESDRKAAARAREAARTPDAVPQDSAGVPVLSGGTRAGLHPESGTGTGTGTGTGSKQGVEDGEKRDPPENPEVESPEAQGHSPTPAGAACRAVRLAGIPDVNPSHPDLLRLMAAGVTAQELADTAVVLVGRGKDSFAYLLRTVEGQRHDAAAKAAVPASAPPPGLTVASSAADRTADYLRQQAERGAAAPPRAVLDALKARRATA